MKEIDPIVSLAFSMHANKGVYALLLGSGVSRSAGIPTGWEIVLDLIKKLAHMQGTDCDPDPAEWYRKEYEKEPDYADLLAILARTQTERAKLLRGYFEPTEEEMEQGLKVPTKAHHAIAQLVADGYVKVIVTTNFDRLLEQALVKINIHPTVISTPDAADGMVPLAHEKAVVVKVNGDYLDSRIKNTISELSKYDKKTEKLLDRIFEEYGLIVCGWSGEWDKGLINALIRCKNIRFSSYWTCLKDPDDNFKTTVQLKKGCMVRIDGADAFFYNLKENVLALALYNASPITKQIAIARLEKYIVEDKYDIELHNLVVKERELVYSDIILDIDKRYESFNGIALANRINRYLKIVDIMLGLVIHGCYWSRKREHDAIWTEVVQRLINFIDPGGGEPEWRTFYKLPALLLIYGGGIAALKRSNYACLYGILIEPQFKKYDEVKSVLCCMDSDERELFSYYYDDGHHRAFPMSDYLFNTLRNAIKEIIPDEKEYDLIFNVFEYFYASIYGYDRIKKGNDRLSVPQGRYMRESSRKEMMAYIEKNFLAANNYGKKWEALQAGFFDGDLNNFTRIYKDLHDFILKRQIY